MNQLDDIIDDIYRAYDEHNTGKVDSNDFHYALVERGFGYEEADELLFILDPDNVGEIKYSDCVKHFHMGQPATRPQEGSPLYDPLENGTHLKTIRESPTYSFDDQPPPTSNPASRSYTESPTISLSNKSFPNVPDLGSLPAVAAPSTPPRSRSTSSSSSSSSDHSKDDKEGEFQWPDHVKVVTADMDKVMQDSLVRIVLECLDQKASEQDTVKEMKKYLDSTHERVWHCFVIRGRYWAFYTHEPAGSFVFKVHDKLYLSWKTPGE